MSTHSTSMVITLSCVAGENIGENFYFLNGKELTREDLAQSLQVANHSPTGFNHGYNGSGPAQLALCVCLKLFGYAGSIVYKKFKSEVIAGLGGSSQQLSFFETIEMRHYQAFIEERTQRLDLSSCQNWEDKVALIEHSLEQSFGDVYLEKAGELVATRYRYIEVELIKEHPEECSAKTINLIEEIKTAQTALIIK